MNEANDTTQRNKLELCSTLLLSFAAFAVTWCTYQGNLWNGIQNFKLAESHYWYRLAQQNALMVAQQQEIDASVTINFLNAVIENKQDRIDYYRRRSRAELATLMSSWLSMDPIRNEQAPPHPLAMPAYKQILKASMAKSDSATSKGEGLWKEAQAANIISDRYTLFTVIFSLVMFLGAISTRARHIKIGYVFIVIATAIILVMSIQLVFITPVTRAGE